MVRVASPLGEEGYEREEKVMIISNQQIQAILRLYGVAKTRASEGERAPGSAQEVREGARDRAELSEEARLYKRARETALQASEVREELVERLRNELESGSYKVQPEDVAEKILRRFLIDRSV
ncbi:MAG TPA: flagellar biosynthesis anti-sigma factor FlgM [Peptococcaceae bacterium]|nr:flagellar biosynthesis anti-sigma factor FlgM [Peptococcaceae bacterium]